MSNIVNFKKEELKEKIIFQNKGLIDLRAIKTFGISSKENAQKAINKIGEDRLMKMFNVLGGKFNE